MLEIQSKKIVEEDSCVEGFNIGWNNGEVAGQTVFHAHVHLIPRRKYDVENPRGGIRHLIPNKGNYEAINKHIVAGSDVDAKSDDGMTPLHYAAAQGHKEIVELLIKEGADMDAGVNSGVEVGMTPLHLAAMDGRKGIVKILISIGANLNTKGHLMISTPLHSAAKYGHKEVAELLISNRADVNAKDGLGWTALLYATK